MRTIIRKISYVWSYEFDKWEPEYREKIFLNDANKVIRIERLPVGEEVANAQ